MWEFLFSQTNLHLDTFILISLLDLYITSTLKRLSFILFFIKLKFLAQIKS